MFKKEGKPPCPDDAWPGAKSRIVNNPPSLLTSLVYSSDQYRFIIVYDKMYL